jgi:hypothetical protein
MDLLVSLLRQDYPTIQFIAGPKACWAPDLHQITYVTDDSSVSLWTMLHELGHALLGHTSYDSDVYLLQKETAAWEKATTLTEKYGVHQIDDNHIQECLDTYRDWLHKRSTCPTCSDHGIQSTQNLYSCLNCQTTWKVSSARFCRPYRLKSALIAT